MRFGSDVYRVIFAAKNRTEVVDHSFRDSINTFRRMAGGDQPLERFRVLNGLGTNDKLKPGDWAKIVVE